MLQNKIDAIKRVHGATEGTSRQTIEVSEVELESYLLFHLRKDIPARLDSVDVQLTEGSVATDTKMTFAPDTTGNAAVDLLIADDEGRNAKDRRWGFAILAIDCLLVETLQAFRQGLTDTRRLSKDLCVKFLTERDAFRGFFTEALATRFYYEFRCGVAHKVDWFDRPHRVDPRFVIFEEFVHWHEGSRQVALVGNPPAIPHHQHARLQPVVDAVYPLAEYPAALARMIAGDNFGKILLRYTPDKRCLELKSYKMYLLEYRNLGIFQENIVNRVLRDLINALLVDYDAGLIKINDLEVVEQEMKKYE